MAAILLLNKGGFERLGDIEEKFSHGDFLVSLVSLVFRVTQHSTLICYQLFQQFFYDKSATKA